MANRVQLGLDNQVFDRLLVTLDKIERSLTSINSTLTSMKKNAGAIKFEFSGTKEFNELVLTISRAKTNQIASLVSSIKTLSEIQLRAKTASDIERMVVAFTSLTNFTKGSFSGFKLAVDTIQSAGSLGSGSIDSLSKIAPKITKFVDALSKIDSSVTDKFTGLFNGLSQLGRLGDLGNLEDFSKVASRLGAGLKKIFEVFNTLKFGSGTKLAGFIATFTAVFQILSAITTRLPGKNAVREVSLTIERLGIGISGMFREVNKIRFGNVARIVAAITTILGAVALVTKFAGNAEKLKAVASVFAGIGLALSAMFKAIDVKRVSETKKVNKIVQERIRFVLDVIKQIKKIKGGKLEGTAEVLKGLAEAIKSVTNLETAGGLSKTSVENLRGFIKSLSLLNGIKVNRNLGSSLSGLSKLFDLKGLGPQANSQAENFGFNLSNSVAAGFVKGTLAVRLLDILTKAFLKLNPISLTGAFVQGVIRQFINLAGSIDRIVDGIVANIQRIGQSLVNVGNNIVNNFGVGRLLQSEAFQATVAFDNLEDKIQIFGNLSDEQTQKIKDLAFEVGRDFPLSANDAAQAALQLIKTGLGVEDIYNALPTAAQLAAAGNVGVAESAELVIRAVSNFDQFTDTLVGGYDNAGTAADIFLGIADLTLAEIPDLAQALAKVGPVANAVGINLEETAAIMGVFANSGLEGARAGTQLRSILRNLTRPVPGVQQRLRSLGIELTDVEGNFLSANEIFNQFVDSFDRLGLTEEEQFEQLSVIFGGEGVAGAAAIIDAGTDSIKSLQDQLAGLPTVGERAVQMMDNFDGDVEQLRGTIETLNVKALQPLLEDIFRPMVKVLRFVADSVLNLDQAILSTITTALAFGSILATVVGSALIFVGVVSQIGGIVISIASSFLLLSKYARLVAAGLSLLTGFVTGLLTLFAGFIIFVPALLALAAAFKAVLAIFRNNLGGANTALEGVKKSLSGLFSAIRLVFDAFSSLFEPLRTDSDIGSGILERLGEGISIFLNAVSAGISRITMFVLAFKDIVDAIKEFLGFGASEPIEENSVLGILTSNPITDTGNSINRTVKTISSTFTGLTENIGEAKKELFSFNERTQSVEDAATSFADRYQDLIDRLSKNPLVSVLLKATGLSFLDVIRFFFRLRVFLGGIKQDFVNVFDVFGTFFSDLGTIGFEQAFKNLKTNLRDRLKSLLVSVFSGLEGVFGLQFGDFVSILSEEGIGPAISYAIGRLLERLKNAFIQNTEGIQNVVAGLLTRIFTPFRFVKTLARLLGIQSIVDLFDTIESVIYGGVSGIIKTISGLLQGQTLQDALVGGFGEEILPLTRFVNALSRAINTVVEIFNDLFAVIAPKEGETFEAPILDIILSIFDILANFLDAMTNLILIPIRNIIRGIDFEEVLSFIGTFFSSIGGFFDSIAVGDFSGALTTIGNIGTAFTDLIASLLTTFFGLEFNVDASLIEIIGQTIFQLLQRGFNAVTGFLSGIDFIKVANDVINFIINAFNSLDLGTTFVPAAIDVANGLGDAFFDVFGRIGEFLGIDTTEFENQIRTGIQTAIDNIKAFFIGDEDTLSIFDSIGSIFNTIKTAVEDLLSVAAGPDVDAPTLSDILQTVVDFLGRVVNLGLEVLTAPLQGIADFFTRIASYDPNEILAISAAVGILAIALIGLTFPGVVSGLAGVATSIGSLAKNLVGFAFVAVLIKGFSENLDVLADAGERLLNLDLSGALGKLTEFVGKGLVGAGFDILGLFGISEVFGQSEEEILATVELIGSAVTDILNNAGVELQNFINNTVLPIVDNIRRVFDSVLRIAGILLDVGLTIILAPITVVLEAIEHFSNLPEENRNRLIIFFTALGASLAWTQRGQIISSLSTAITKLGPALTSAAGPLKAFATQLLPLFIIFNFAAAALKNIDKLFDFFTQLADLDLSGAIASFVDFFLNTFVDFAFQLANLFGFDTILGQSIEDFKITIAQLVLVVEFSLIQLGNKIKFTFEDIFRDLGMRFNIAAADIRLTIADLNARLSTVGGGAEENPFFKIAQQFQDLETFNIVTLANAALQDPEIDQAALIDFSIKYQDALIKSFAENTQIGLFDILPEETLIESLRLLQESAALDDAIIEIFKLGPEATANLATTLGEVFNNPAALEQLGIDGVRAIADAIRRAVDRGDLSPEDALNLLDLIVITPESSLPIPSELLDTRQFVEDYKATYDRLTTEAEATINEDPDSIDVTQTLNLDFLTNQETFQDEVKTTVDDAAAALPTTGESAVVVEVPVVPVAPTEVTPQQTIQDLVDEFTGYAAETGVEVPVTPVLSTLTSIEDIQQASIDIANLNTAVLDTESTFMRFAELVNTNVENINSMSTATTNTQTAISDGFVGMATAFTSFLTSFSITLALYIISLNFMQTQTLAATSVIEGAAKRIADSFYLVALNIASVAAGILALRAMGGINVQVTSTTAGIPVDGGREFGGPVQAGRLYEVNEGEIPELLRSGSRTFLLPGRDGVVIPPILPNRGLQAQPVASNAAIGGFGGGGIVINEGGITISIDGTVDNAVGLTEQVRNVVREEMATNRIRVREALRTAGR